jgi:hypothetical protein
MDSRVQLYFVFSTANVLADVLFEEWPLVFVFMLLWRCGIIAWMIRIPPGKTSVAFQRAMAIPFLVSAFYWMDKSPFVWESNLWTVQTDLVMALWLLINEQNDDATVPCQTVEEMFCIFYGAAGFWKLNTHFLDPNASCATVFFVQNLAAYMPVSFDTKVGIASMLKPLAPKLVLAIELAMGGLISIGRVTQKRQWTNAGLLATLYFHLAVCMTPRPNDISLFGLQCAGRLVVLADRKSLETAATQVKPWALPFGASVVLVTVTGVRHDFTPQNWAFAMFVPVMSFLTLVLALERAIPTKESADSKTKTKRPAWTIAASTFAGLYAFGSIMVGLQEEATPNMFANLKVHGGSNHFLLPTGLLFRYFYSAGDLHPFGGGVVRLEATTSDWLQSIYPADLTHTLQPVAAANILQAIGNPRPNFFNSGANRVLGLTERGLVPPHPHGSFIPYTVPALELKRLLKEAFEKDRSFVLTYSQLQGVSGDEVWRARATARRIKLRVRDGKIAKCDVVYPTRAKCAKTDLPYQLKVPWWIERIATYHGYPILFDDHGQVRRSITCFGP